MNVRTIAGGPLHQEAPLVPAFWDERGAVSVCLRLWTDEFGWKERNADH
jgi:hypothetical protein